MKNLLSIYSKPDKCCQEKPSEDNLGPTLSYKNVPFQKLNWYNIEKEDFMSCICVSYFNDIYISSDSLNLILDEKGEIVEEKMIQKIFQKDNILIANCGLTTLGENGFEVGERIAEANIKTSDDFSDFCDSLKEPYKKRLQLTPNIINALEIIFIQHTYDKNFGHNIYIQSRGFNKKEEKYHILSRYQTGIWGSSQKRYKGFYELVEKDPQKHMKKIIEYNYGETVGGPIQMYKMSQEGEITNLSDAPFN